MLRSRALLLVSLTSSLSLACNDDGAGDSTGSGTETGDGDGDPTTGDGDGDGDPTTGDGDGDPTTGDGDGDPTTGDGDGDPTTGDGDGDPTTGDGDGDPADDAIYAIQDGTIPSGTPVDVDGVWVTAITSVGVFAQEPAGGEYSGVWVYAGANGPDISGLAIGDLIDVEGVTGEFNEITEIDASAGTIVEVGVLDPTPAPDLVEAAALTPELGEPWESVLVRIEGAPLTVVALPGFDELVVSDATGDVFVDNYLYNLIADGGPEFPNFGLGATFTAIQGPLNFSFANFKIAPRFAGDLEGYVEP